MGSETSKLVLAADNQDTKGGKTNTDVGMVDVDLPLEDCLAALPDDPISCLQCLSFPFKLCLGLCLG